MGEWGLLALLRTPLITCLPCLLPSPQVSEGMRSLGTSVYLLTVAVGTYLASALIIIVAAASPHDLWVSDNPLYGHYDWCDCVVAAPHYIPTPHSANLTQYRACPNRPSDCHMKTHTPDSPPDSPSSMQTTMTLQPLTCLPLTQ